MLLLMLSILIPPPENWEPPRADGPGLFCGRTFTLDIAEGESLWQEWPGEIAQRDVYGTYHLNTSSGDVVISEHGSRSIPEGAVHAVPLGPALGFSVYDDQPRTYRLRAADGGNIEAVIVRFADTFSPDEAAAVLRRFRRDREIGVECLQPENRR